MKVGGGFAYFPLVVLVAIAGLMVPVVWYVQQGQVELPKILQTEMEVMLRGVSDEEKKKFGEKKYEDQVELHTEESGEKVVVNVEPGGDAQAEDNRRKNRVKKDDDGGSEKEAEAEQEEWQVELEAITERQYTPAEVEKAGGKVKIVDGAMGGGYQPIVRPATPVTPIKKEKGTDCPGKAGGVKPGSVAIGPGGDPYLCQSNGLWRPENPGEVLVIDYLPTFLDLALKEAEAKPEWLSPSKVTGDCKDGVTSCVGGGRASCVGGNWVRHVDPGSCANLALGIKLPETAEEGQAGEGLVDPDTVYILPDGRVVIDQNANGLSCGYAVSIGLLIKAGACSDIADCLEKYYPNGGDNISSFQKHTGQWGVLDEYYEIVEANDWLEDSNVSPTELGEGLAASNDDQGAWIELWFYDKNGKKVNEHHSLAVGYDKTKGCLVADDPQYGKGTCYGVDGKTVIDGQGNEVEIDYELVGAHVILNE